MRPAQPPQSTLKKSVRPVLLCFYGSLCRHPRAVEPVLSLALGPATEPPAPEPVLIRRAEDYSYERRRRVVP